MDDHPWMIIHGWLSMDDHPWMIIHVCSSMDDYPWMIIHGWSSMDDHPWMTIHGWFFDNFWMFSHVFRMIFSDFREFQVDPECFRMIPERPKAFSDRFGAIKVSKSQIQKKSHSHIRIPHFRKCGIPITGFLQIAEMRNPYNGISPNGGNAEFS